MTSASAPQHRIALDAMGGDAAPGPEIEGAVAAVRAHPVEVIVVGDEARLREQLVAAGFAVEAQHGPGRLRLRHASQVITMDDHPGTAFKSKKDSSMRVCFELAAAGEADAVVSAGNSGAMLAGGVLMMKRIRGVERPGLMTLSPTHTGSRCVVLDVGANTEPKPTTLAQFAVLGATYARRVLGVARPRVGLLANGEEESKGTALTRETHRLLREVAVSLDFDFLGYAEGGDFFPGRFDVIVTDGFTGNVALKTSEGTTRAIFAVLEREVRRSLRGKLGALLLKPAFRALKRWLDPDVIGGAPLLGVDGVAVVCHGRASGKAIENAILGAARLVEARLAPALTEAVARHHALWESAQPAAG